MADDTTASSLHNALHHLSLDTKTEDRKDNKPAPAAKAAGVQKKPRRKPKHQVADSWEDESISSSSSAAEDDERNEEESVFETSPPSSLSSQGIHAPPPTPISPLLTTSSPRLSSPDPSSAAPRIRPEKQTLVANRMIAGALGLRTPKRTEEQKAYDKAMREKEVKKREREREEEKRRREEEERAKRAVWEA